MTPRANPGTPSAMLVHHQPPIYASRLVLVVVVVESALASRASWLTVELNPKSYVAAERSAVRGS